MTWYVYHNGRHIGQVTAKTKAAALRKARYEWGSSGEWTDAQLRKFTVRKVASNPGKAVRLTNFSGTITRQRNGQVKITGRKRTVRKRK